MLGKRKKPKIKSKYNDEDEREIDIPEGEKEPIKCGECGGDGCADCDFSGEVPDKELEEIEGFEDDDCDDLRG